MGLSGYNADTIGITAWSAESTVTRWDTSTVLLHHLRLPLPIQIGERMTHFSFHSGTQFFKAVGRVCLTDWQRCCSKKDWNSQNVPPSGNWNPSPFHGIIALMRCTSSTLTLRLECVIAGLGSIPLLRVGATRMVQMTRTQIRI